MSFGGFGSGGFGQNTNQPSAFGGFGSTANNTATGGFGSTNNATTSGTGLFGSSGRATFGSNTGAGGFGGAGFGGAKPAFGTPTTTGGMFGASTTATTGTTGFGSTGFGSTSNTTTTPFGGGGSSLFGAKPATGFGTGSSAFGSSSTTGGGLFGSGTTTTPATTAFGATNNPGIGTNIGDPPGTATVAFQPTVEKETANPAQSNSFQNILFMDAYKKWSADELRLVDYNQGRQKSSPGGTGAFGSSGFGTGGFGTNTTNTGFGANTGTGMFGANQNTTTGGFGATNTANTGGFGSTGGLFGSKPAATGGLFGSTATTTQPASTGGLFGGSGFGSNNTANTGATTGGFGTNTASTGTGLFGGANTAAAKPAGFGGFGNTGGGGFGNTNTTATQGFGTNAASTTTGGGLFGGGTAANTTGGGLFGGGNTQQQQGNPGFGSSTFGGQNQAANTGGLFANQQKPGLFGSATPAAGNTGGLFGSTGATGTNTLGGATAAQPAGGLFGAKPAGTGTGLFGGSSTAQPASTGTGLFGGLGGATQQQPPAQTSLFGGSLGQGTQNKPSLFGTTPAAGGSLFGGQTQQGNSLFGGGSQQGQPGLGNSFLGASQASQQPQQAFSTSINDLSAYGSTTLFSGLPDDKIQNPGPLATPLSGTAKVKSRSILPMYKLSPANVSRLATPQKRGYGFTYSTHGSPSSPSSVASTPGGLGQSLLIGSINRGLSKSISASNLRRSFNVEDSILQPGAFSASNSMRLLGTSNTHKKLVINRDMRSDLFTAPAKDREQVDDANGARKLTKRVSFDTSTVETPDNAPKALPSTEDAVRAGETSYPKLNGSNGSQSSPAVATPEMEQVKGNELAIVHEEESPAPARRRDVDGIEPGAYWMSPPADEIRAMNRMQRQKVANFVVGRENVGSVAFKVPVDLSNIALEELFDVIVVLEPRQATVYPISAKKPPVGKGLNVPSLISLEHSFPRGRKPHSARRIEKHIEKLKSITDTTFESYDNDTGVWTFSVEHFTTYGLDDDDDDDDETELGPVIPAHLTRPTPAAQDAASPAVDPDDTFEFKRSRRAVPGAFNEAEVSDEEDDSQLGRHQGTQSPDSQEADARMQSREWPEDESMADGHDEYQLEPSDQQSLRGSEEDQDDFAVSRFADGEAQVPAGILRARMRAVKKSTAPTKIEVAGGDDWTQILQASVRAPRTIDRATLRAMNESGAVWDLKDRGSPTPTRPVAAGEGPGFATSIDLMKSLFEQAKGPTQPAPAVPGKGFVKWPYEKRPKTQEEEAPAVPRFNWGPNALLVTAQQGEPTLQQPVDGPLADSGTFVATPKTLSQLQQYIDITTAQGAGEEAAGPNLRELAHDDPVWELAALLFDDNGANLPAFWKHLVSEATNRALAETDSPEEKAIICLAGNRVADACGHLLAAGNFRLATLVASIGTQSKDIRTQLKDWRESNILAEVSEPIRAIYELLAGNPCVCTGVKGVPIENRVDSFTISERFGLDWLQSFGLRLFYARGDNLSEAIRSFQADVEQDREPEPDSALWSLLKVFANREFDWSDARLWWLLTRAIHATGKVSFGPDAAEKLDMASVSFASALTAQGHWVPATFVLLQLSEEASREAAVRDHLGRHAHAIGASNSPSGPFSALRKFGVPEGWIWEAKALDFRARGESRQEFLALVWAGNYVEANAAFLGKVGPELVIARDYKKLFKYSELLWKVKRHLPGFESGAGVYLLYPMAREQSRHHPLDRFDNQLFDGLVALWAAAHGDMKQEAAIADMAETLIQCRGGDGRLFQLLPEDVGDRYVRAQALENVR